ncbi:MAG: Ig domain-containing protein [Bacteroidales bacterium]|nr:Ig domain-containing protein [Bacteroidales bacterium]
MKAKLFWLLAAVCLLLAVSCEKEPQPVNVTGVTVSPTSLSLVEGESGDLTATVSPSNADNASVTWDSSDKSVATVSNGKVTAVKAGSANITVKTVDGGFTASCAVTVAAKVIDVSSVSLSKTELTLTEGDSETITATVKPDDATDKTVTWSSSDTAVATVDGGKIAAVKEGTATITAKAGDKTATCKVTVEKKVIAVESVELDKTAIELTEGESQTLAATVKPDDATDKTVEWSTSDAEVATVEAGVVTAVKEGTATITAKAGEKTATCTVTVKKKVIEVESVELDKTALELTEGESQTLVATVKPDDATDKTVEWSTSDAEVATVEAGVVTAVKEGTATITAKAGDKTATCAVTVKAKENPITGLFGDYTISSVIIAEDDEGMFYSYGTWEMAITPYEGSSSRIWIDKIVPLFSKEVAAKYFPHGEVYAEVSEDMKTITIPVPQEVKSTAAPFGTEYDEPLVLYKCAGDDAYAAYETTEGVITFTLQEDGSWKTLDSFGFTIASCVKEGLFSSYMNCYGGFNPDYPTLFVKNGDSTQNAKAAPARKASQMGKLIQRERRGVVSRILNK